MILTTTLNLLKAAGACTDRYEHLLQCLGGPSFDHDTPINLLTILELNGLADTEWCLLNATVEDAAPLLAEYRRQAAPLLAEYERQNAALLQTLLRGGE